MKKLFGRIKSAHKEQIKAEIKDKLDIMKDNLYDK